MPVSHLPDPGLDDVEIHQFPAEEVERTISNPGHQEESCQPEKQTQQEGLSG